jgi:hypothetical protein
MKHVFKFESEFTNDDDVITERITHEHSEEVPTIEVVVDAFSRFISAAFGYPIHLDYDVGFAKDTE